MNRMLTLACIALASSTQVWASSPAESADQMFKEGLTFCNQASKLSRTDAAQARAEFSQYLSHFERANAIDNTLLESNSFVAREHKRCALIEDNIARAEAMPVVEQSLAKCGEARSALSNGQLDEAEASYSEFERLRDDALAITPTVLRVGSVAVRMRVCDRLPEKIAVAETDQVLLAQKASRALDAFNKAMASCDAGHQLLKASSASTGTVKAAESMLTQMQQDQARADALVSELNGSAPQPRQVAAMSGRVEQCGAEMTASIKQVKTVIAQQALAAAEAEKAAIQAAQLADQEAVSMLQGQEIVQMGDGSL